MKLIKLFTCLVVCFVVLSSSFMVGYAADDYLYTVDDLIDMGAYLLDDGCYVLPGNPYLPSTLLSSEKNYTSFDISKVNWSVMPSYIQEIVYSSISDITKDYNDPSSKVPFVLVDVINQSYYRIYAGFNVGLGRSNDANGSLSIVSIRPGSFLDGSNVSSGASAWYNSCLYTTTFRILDNKATSDWVKVEPSRIDSLTLTSSSARSTVYSYAYLGNLQSSLDFYLYGANYVRSVLGIESVNYFRNDSGTNLTTFSVSQNGFFSGSYFYLQAQYEFIYAQSFTPATPEQIQQQLQQEQNSLLDEGNKLQQEQNDLIDQVIGEIQSAGESDLTTLPDDAFSDFNKAESDLVSGYNPDNIEDDLDIDIDSSALGVVWDLVDDFVTSDNTVFTLFVSILSLGIIALILGR